MNPNLLTTDALRIPIEMAVSGYLQREWRVRDARDMNDFACHPCAILSDGAFRVFAKYSDAQDGRVQFEVELDGLRRLKDAAGVRVPTPVGVIDVRGGCVLVMEAEIELERTTEHWREIGRALAKIHRVKGARFGLERDGFFGPLPQVNTPMDDWVTFYAECRLQPYLKMGVDGGKLPVEVARRVERLVNRLPGLCGAEVQPTLLHGDAQKNNYISTAAGAVVIDPAVYFGNPEVDLAFVDIYEPVPEDVLEAYREEMPIDPGFLERKDLWRLHGYLAGVAVDGWCLDKLVAAVGHYL